MFLLVSDDVPKKLLYLATAGLAKNHHHYRMKNNYRIGTYTTYRYTYIIYNCLDAVVDRSQVILWCLVPDILRRIASTRPSTTVYQMWSSRIPNIPTTYVYNMNTKTYGNYYYYYCYYRCWLGLGSPMASEYAERHAVPLRGRRTWPALISIPCDRAGACCLKTDKLHIIIIIAGPHVLRMKRHFGNFTDLRPET